MAGTEASSSDQHELPDYLIEAYYQAEMNGDEDKMNEIDRFVSERYGISMGW